MLIIAVGVHLNYPHNHDDDPTHVIACVLSYLHYLVYCIVNWAEWQPWWHGIYHISNSSLYYYPSHPIWYQPMPCWCSTIWISNTHWLPTMTCSTTCCMCWSACVTCDIRLSSSLVYHAGTCTADPIPRSSCIGCVLNLLSRSIIPIIVILLYLYLLCLCLCLCLC